ncbi:CIR protein [Plasmodium chabaudi chabaudi]|uniref:PIR protein n=1 Tax=Plasmodium chabaudi chabaudi TaxID=31271 RepID=A0A4V0KDS6_PLACU|nr:CIR protein [Plasmodium chabaudi chabaudi]VTZ71364.1 CIR protein [Plasmodium chabaudi chabaudi]|eukprot:XP_016655118.1 CIR protein [Plasmodium chabaudi chabaudi]
MSKEVCKVINDIEKNILFDSGSQKYEFKNDIFKAYCPYEDSRKRGGKRQCDSNGKILGAAFIALLKNLDSVEDYEENLKKDILSEYAILWLGYKNDQNPNRLIGVDNVYDMLTRNDWFREHYNSIKGKKNIMKIYFSYLNNLYTLLKKICDTINKCNDPSNNKECIDYANKCVKLYQEFAKTGPTYHEYCHPYCSALSNLKNDYEKFRKKNNNKDLPEMALEDGAKNCESLCRSKEPKLDIEELETEDSEMDIFTEDSLSDQPSTEVIDSREKTVSEKEDHMDGSKTITFQTVIPTSINNANKLPYIAVPFILVSIILGISYKYLTHGWRKRSNAKKKMKTIINLCDVNKTKKEVTNGSA